MLGVTVECGNQSGYPGPNGELVVRHVEQSSDMIEALVNAKPCQRCGCLPDFNERLADPKDSEYRGYNVQCYACGIVGPSGNPAEAVAGWNSLDQITRIGTYVDGVPAYQMIRSEGGYEQGGPAWFGVTDPLPSGPLPRQTDRRAILRKNAARLANRAARKARKGAR